MTVSKRTIFTVLIFTCIANFSPSYAGRLDDFEKDATKSSSSSSSSDSSDSYDSNSGSIADSIFPDFSFITDFYIFLENIYQCGETSMLRSSSMPIINILPEEDLLSDIQPHKLGEAITSFVKLETTYQNIESDIDTVDARIEVGYGPFAVQLRIPLISATYSTRSRPPIPEDLGQFVGAKRRC